VTGLAKYKGRLIVLLEMAKLLEEGGAARRVEELARSASTTR